MQAKLTSIEEGQSSADERIANAYIRHQPQPPAARESEAVASLEEQQPQPNGPPTDIDSDDESELGT